MKKILLIISCLLIGMQLNAEYSWASCKACSKTVPLKNQFDPEWERFSGGRNDYGMGCDRCQEDSSEFASQEPY